MSYNIWTDILPETRDQRNPHEFLVRYLESLLLKTSGGIVLREKLREGSTIPESFMEAALNSARVGGLLSFNLCSMPSNEVTDSSGWHIAVEYSQQHVAATELESTNLDLA